MATAQHLLTIAADSLLLGATALYGYLFISGLLCRSYKPAQASAAVPATIAQTTPVIPAAQPLQPRADVPEPIALPDSIASTPAQLLHSYNSMSNPNLIAAAKAADYPKAKKWSKTRPIGLKARQGAIEFLMAVSIH